MHAATLPNPAALMARNAVAVVATSQYCLEPLLPAEARYVAARFMQPQRAAEFRAGRACARRALLQFGFRNWPLLPAATREPQWPEGVVGSITHSGSYCAAAVASVQRCAGLGIDVEAIARVGDDVAALICTARELRDIAGETGRQLPRAAWFSAKESVFKALFPCTRLPFEPSDVEIVFDTAQRSFRVSAPGQPRLERICAQIDGRFALAGEHVMTTAWLDRARLRPGADRHGASTELDS